MARTGAVAVLLAGSAVPLLAGVAAGEGSLSDLRARMDSIQAELDAATARLEELRTQVEVTEERIHDAEERSAELRKQNARLLEKVIERADELYRAGGMDMVGVLFSSETIAELSDRVEILSRVSINDNEIFVELARSQAELEALQEELADRRGELSAASSDLAQQSDLLQSRFNSVSAEYEELRRELAAAAAQQKETVSAPPGPAQRPPAPVVRSTNGMPCPVAGPVSFIDSWGAPRAGHTHQGVDMMAAYGTPVVAIVSGTITYAAYDGSGGNMIFLSGDDGNAYWYLHNQQNLVSGGRVSAGEQIATVGDTGNAAGTPHLHFEYHPGGGAAVNPYPLVAPIC